MKLLEENIGVNLHDLGFVQGFLHTIPKVQTTEGREIDKLGFIKSKNLGLPWWRSG